MFRASFDEFNTVLVAKVNPLREKKLKRINNLYIIVTPLHLKEVNK